VAFETSPDEAAFGAVYRSEPLDPAILAGPNPDADFQNVCAQLEAFGLPA
jgi:hypothetical protein